MNVENNDTEDFEVLSNEVEDNTNPYDVFNEPISVSSDNDDDILFEDFIQSEENSLNQEQSNATDVKNTNEENDIIDPNEINFEDDLAVEAQPKEEEEDVESEDDLIERLKARGYKIEKDNISPTDKETVELKKIDDVLTQANSFISQSDETVVKEKLKSDLAKSYTQQNKQHLIGTEEFEIDLEAEYSEYEDNNTMRKLFADNVRRDVKDVISKNEIEKTKITSVRDKEAKNKITQNRLNLQNGIKAIAKQGVFGVRVSPDEAKEIYKSVTSGEFAKTVNDDPNLVAEFATYLKHRESITQKLGGPTYGEGIKAAVDALLGDDKKASKTPLVQAMKNSSNGQGGSIDRKSSWGLPTVEKIENKDKAPQRVAGSGLDFL